MCNDLVVDSGRLSKDLEF